jgi:hypothetical protein
MASPSWRLGWTGGLRRLHRPVAAAGHAIAPIDLLPAGSPFIAASELDLLVCLLRIAQWRHARPRGRPLAPLRQQLARCARPCRRQTCRCGSARCHRSG